MLTRMSGKPKRILLVAAGLSLVMVLFPPCYVEIETEMSETLPGPLLVKEEFYGYKFLFASPRPVGSFWGYRYRPAYGLLLAQQACLWLAALGVIGGLRINRRRFARRAGPGNAADVSANH